MHHVQSYPRTAVYPPRQSQEPVDGGLQGIDIQGRFRVIPMDELKAGDEDGEAMQKVSAAQGHRQHV
jgi:hypothetical protein